MIVDFRLRVFFLKFKRYKEWFYNLGKLATYTIKLRVTKFKKPFIWIFLVCYINQYSFKYLKTDVVQKLSFKEMVKKGRNATL